MIEFFSGLDLSSALGGADYGWVGGVVTLLLAGMFGPAIIAIFLNVLRVPVLRQLVGAWCYGWGKGLSLLATKRLGTWGRKLEDGLQDFFDFCHDKFDEGLDADDKTSTP